MVEPVPVLPDGITVEQLAERIRAKEVDLERLLGELPVLVFKPKVGEDDSPVYQTPADGGDELPEPGDTSVLRREEAGALATVLRTAIVVPLTLSNRNLYEDRILLGRAGSCDVRLISPLVSKLHASVYTDEEGQGWRIADEGSSNGTRLNGMPLEPHRMYRLRPSDELLLGDVTALFLDAEGLAQLCSLA